jgi:hypothetical protein
MEMERDDLRVAQTNLLMLMRMISKLVVRVVVEMKDGRGR